MILKRNNIKIKKLKTPMGNDDCAIYYREQLYCYGNFQKAREKFKGCYIVKPEDIG